MTSGLSSPSRPWFRLVPFDQDLAADASVRVWLAEVERRLYGFLAGTNFYGAMKSGYAEMGMFGTEACVMVEHWQAGAVCHAMTAGEYWLSLSDASVPDTLYRRCPMTVHQVVQSFGLDGVSDFVRNAHDSGRYDQPVNVCHAIEPNKDRVEGAEDRVGASRWRSVYWDENDGDAARMLRVNGYEEQPFWAPRWDTIGGDTYGTAPAGLTRCPTCASCSCRRGARPRRPSFWCGPKRLCRPPSS